MKKLWLALVLINIVSLLNAQSNVTITIDATSARIPVSPYIYGKNNSLSDSPGSSLSLARWQLLRDAGIRMFRECGGNNSTKYNWKRKLSSHPDWYNNVYNHDWDFAAKSLQQNIPSAQGTWAFQLIGKTARTNTANFNDWGYNQSKGWSGVGQNLAGGGTINTAGGNKALKDGNPDLYLENWPPDSTVKILDKWFGKGGIGLDSSKIRYWGMDNEPEIWVGTHDDVIKQQPAAEQFMQTYFEVAKLARLKFPGIKLCGPVPANEWQWYNWNGDAISYKNAKYVWLEYFILRIAEEQKATGIRLLDVLDIHFYPGETKTEDILQTHRVFFDRNYVYPGANGVKRIGGGWNTSLNREYILGRCEDWLTKYIGPNHGVKFGVSEIGLETNDINVNAISYASILGEFARNKVELFTPWSWKAGMMEVLHLFSRYGHMNYMNSTSSLEQFVSAYPTVNANSDSITIILVNRHLTEQKNIEIDLKNFQVKNEPVYMYSLSKLPANETFVTHTQNALKKSQLSAPVFNINATIEPLSVNAIVLKSAPTGTQNLNTQNFEFTVYPNPVHGFVKCTFNLASDARVNMDLIDVNGRKIKTICNKVFHSGKNLINADVSELPGGVYFIRINSDYGTGINRIVLNH